MKEYLFPEFVEGNEEEVKRAVEAYIKEACLTPDRAEEAKQPNYMLSYLFFQGDLRIIQLILSQMVEAELDIKQASRNTYYIDFSGGRPSKGNLGGKRGYGIEYDVRCAFHEMNVPHLDMTSTYLNSSKFHSIQPRFMSKNTRHYYREDLGFAPRSSWEANVARILNLCKVPFRYEASSIQRQNLDGKKEVVGYYIPDFFLDDTSFIEVKGRWDSDSRKKILEISKQHQEYTSYIIDGDMYYSLERKYADTIDMWESSSNFPREVLAQVVGISFGKRKQVVSMLQGGQRLQLRREPDNPYDQNAILVLTEDEQDVGYLAADWACIYAQKLDMGMEFSVTIKEVKPKVIDVIINRTNVEEEILFDFLKY